MTDLSARHHTLIQALLSRGPLTEEDFHASFEGLTGKSPRNNQQLFNQYLRKINKELAYVQFELRGCRNQYDGKVYYGVVNNVADEQSKMGTRYSVPQIAFYKGVIEAIVQDVHAQGTISSIYALNIPLENLVQCGTGSQSHSDAAPAPAALKNFSASQKQKTLNELVQDQWLCSTPDGKIGLGVRSFLDLRSWFHNNDIPSCEVCNEAGVKVDLCQNEGCTVRIHQYCLRKKFSQKRAERFCPGCGTQWPYKPPEVETSVEEDELDTHSQSSAPPRPTMRKKPRSCKTDDATAGGSSSSQPTEPVPDFRRTRRSSRLR